MNFWRKRAPTDEVAASKLVVENAPERDFAADAQMFNTQLDAAAVARIAAATNAIGDLSGKYQAFWSTAALELSCKNLEMMLELTSLRASEARRALFSQSPKGTFS